MDSPLIGSIGDAHHDALTERGDGPDKAGCIRTTFLHDCPNEPIAEVAFAAAGWADSLSNLRPRSNLDNLPFAECKCQ